MNLLHLSQMTINFSEKSIISAGSTNISSEKSFISTKEISISSGKIIFSQEININVYEENVIISENEDNSSEKILQFCENYSDFSLNKKVF